MKELNYYDVVMIGIGYILGAGIYALLGVVTKHAGNMTWLSILIIGILTLCSSYSYIKISSSEEGNESEYNILKEGLGHTPSIMIVIFSIVSVIFSCATISIGFGNYLENLTGIPSLVGGTIVLATTCYINIMGLRKAVNVNTITTILEVIGLIIVIIIGFNKWNYKKLMIMPYKNKSESAKQILYGSYLFSFAFFGFETLIRLSEDTENSSEIIPIAIRDSIVVTMILYILVAISSISLLGGDKLGKSKAPLSDVIKTTNIPMLSKTISVIALGSAYNTVLMSILTNSRLINTLVNKNIINIPLINKYLKRDNNETKNETYNKAENEIIPVNAIILNGILAFLVMVLVSDIEKTTVIANLGIVTLLIAVNVSYLSVKNKQITNN